MNIVLIGASEHAKVVMDIVEKEGKHRIVGLADTYKPAEGRLFGYEILGNESTLAELFQRGEISGGLIAIGDNWTRREARDRVLSLVPNFTFVRAIHPSAQIARGVEIGAGTVVMAGVVINPESRVAEHCILNTRASLDHDCRMAEFSSLAPGVTTGGQVNIGAFSAIGLGASIIHGISVGEHSALGAGAVAVKDIPAYCVAYGVPARVVRSRQAGEKYL